MKSVIVASLLVLPGYAQDWPHWRGPNFDGSAEAEGLPAEFGREEGHVWAVGLPGPGAATPIVHGRHVFATAIEPEEGLLLALAFDRENGEMLWEDVAGSGYRPGEKGSRTQLHDRSNYASPSPVTDGQRVFFLFGNGDLAAYDMEGEPLWRMNLQQEHGDFAFQWTFSASPTLFGGRLYLPILQRDEPANGLGKDGGESFLLALDPKNGATVFRHVRPSKARMESLESYATMIPYVGPKGRKELLVVGGDVITGHDPGTGKELWRWGTWNEGHREMWWRLVPSPVVGRGLVLACGPKGASVCAVRLGGEGVLVDESLAWRSAGRRNPVTTDVPTPLFYRDHFYVLSDLREALSKLDPETGEIEWKLELPGRDRWRASPTGADGKVYCVNHAGLVVVVDAKSGDILAENVMGEPDEDQIRASIAVAHGRLFLRTNQVLYCLGS